MWLPLATLCSGVEFICGKVHAVAPAYVDVGYQRIRYDYLVISTGSQGPVGFRGGAVTSAARAIAVDADAKQLASPAVGTVAVVGGGLTSIEYAAAVKAAHPTKRVRAC